MPNWCNNNVTFTHAKPDMLARVASAYNENRLFSEFFPCPEELKEVGVVSNDVANAMLEKYGVPDQYNWQLDNWGTKWEVDSVDVIDVDVDLGAVSVYFDSAWMPPLQFYENMEKLGFEIEAYYYEPGMAFCGKYHKGSDNYFEIIENNSRWVDENIPNDINEVFAISENLDIEEQTNNE